MMLLFAKLNTHIAESRALRQAVQRIEKLRDKN